MTRRVMIQRLKKIAPLVTQVTGTTDMGFEFSAVVPNGVIYAKPGMLLDYSDGYWPPNKWKDKTAEKFKVLLRNFLLDESWQVIAWEDLSDEEIEQWLEEAEELER